jgi:diadenosine tetraphosphate (Ap4A) HIT family hydrolase
MSEGCVFCDQSWMRAAEIIIETPHCIFASTRDPDIRAQAGLPGWNQGSVLHPHMHVIPRFDDEPLSDRWLRSAINAPENRRPDPWAPGSGRELRGAK